MDIDIILLSVRCSVYVECNESGRGMVIEKYYLFAVYNKKKIVCNNIQ